MQLQRNQPERSGALQAGQVVKQAVQYPGLERGDAVVRQKEGGSAFVTKQ